MALEEVSTSGTAGWTAMPCSAPVGPPCGARRARWSAATLRYQMTVAPRNMASPSPMPQGPRAAICLRRMNPPSRKVAASEYTTGAQVGAMWWMLPCSSAAPRSGSADPARPVSGTGTRRRLAGLATHSMMPMYRHAPKNAPSRPTPASSGLSLVR